MVEIVKNIEGIRSRLPMSVELVAVSKTHPADYVVEAYSCGQRIFGENKVQEMCEKHEALKDSCPDIKWHLIGHLQTNKVKYITSFVDMIQSVDSLKLLAEIDKHAKKDGRVVKCLFEMHIASEDTKFGLDREELVQILESDEFKAMQNVKICGLMGMATNTDDTEKVRADMRSLKETFDFVKKNYFAKDLDFREISMGMSSDWKIAIQEGSTMVRIGSTIFGKRNYGVVK
ncbi:MAG: YggS family pyridoxal phosphate-dependent enzyme [Bacteroidales bacterium]|nr:YggS family pyridoxal phosphate-dependent enzyme [Bacteroidales bacterium]